MPQEIIKITDGTTRMPEWNMAQPVNFCLCDKEHIAIVGNNGSGKSMLVSIITGAHPLKGDAAKYNFSPSEKDYISDNIKYISFEDAYGSSNAHYYLQQRWNMHDIDDDTPTAGKVLDEAYRINGDDSAERRELRDRLYEAFGIEPMLNKFVISLSSGELRKLHITKSLMNSPRVLILDNPFIGLDAATRQLLSAILKRLAEEFRIQIILVLSRIENIPDFITHIVEVKDLKVLPKVPMDEFKNRLSAIADNTPRSAESKTEEELITGIRDDDKTADDFINASDEIIKLNNVSIRYGERTILKDLCWTVKKGERWALNGQNGAGKSTLLSLICADNPQSYACDITLFGRSRGSGESIWEIKKHIGYVSPEMHRAYKHDLPVVRIMASGMKDSVGLYARPTEEEYECCRRWLKIFGIEGWSNRNFLSLSSGEQRMVLLARAFVKDPQLLILDEPFHGLDNRNRNKATRIINAFANRKDKTIIMVSHYKDEYPSCIDHEIVLKRNQ